MKARLFTRFSVAGADPKSVLCVFFKQGQCSKGDKCKFSHDLTLERKSEKKSIYADNREDALENGSQRINSKSSVIKIRIMDYMILNVTILCHCFYSLFLYRYNGYMGPSQA